MSHNTDKILAAAELACHADQLLTTDEVAAMTGYSKHTLAQYRSLGRGGPAYLKRSRGKQRIWYRCDDVQAWMADAQFTRVEPTTGGAA